MHLIKVALIGLAGLNFGWHQSAGAEPGFIPFTSETLPQAVRTSAQKVLEIWTPGRIAVKSESEYLEIKAGLYKNLNGSMRRFMRDKFNASEIEFCIRHKMPVCPLTKTAARGSAFITEGGKLLAASHDFWSGDLGLGRIVEILAQNWKLQMANPQLHAQAQADIDEFESNPLKHVRFVLANSQGDVVFSSTAQSFHFLRFGRVNRFAGEVDLVAGRAGLRGDQAGDHSESYSGSTWITNDLVEIELSVELPSIKLADAQCSAGDSSYNTGYARATKTRSHLGRRNSEDRELTVSSGQVLSEAQFRERGRDWPYLESFIAQTRGHQLLVNDADATIGMSGGPVLNSRGEACGLYKGLFPGNENIEWDLAGRFYKMFSLIAPVGNR